MSENKVPCGGFRIGDGLTMDGDTLKSLGGAYVKVKTNIIDGKPAFEFMDDSPLKTFEEIVQKMETSPVTLLAFISNKVFPCFFNGYYSGTIDSLTFCTLSVAIDNNLTVVKIFIDSDNKITLSQSQYTLTPAT